MFAGGPQPPGMTLAFIGRSDQHVQTDGPYKHLLPVVPAFPQAEPEGVGLDSANVDELAAIVQGYFDRGLIVGAELLVVKNRKTALHCAVGWKDRENQAAMELNTVFNIRSMSKPLTGAAAQILIGEGWLTPDDFVMDYLPSFAHWSHTITLTQLLTHRSGIPLSILSGLNDYPDLYTIAQAVGTQGPQFTPGAKFWYSDSGSDCVGAIVELACGQLLNEFLQERLFDPLGMKDTFSYTAGDPNDERWDRTASLYVPSQGEWIKHWEPDGTPWYPFAWGSQTVYSTPMDYARFLAMWMDQGVSLEGEQILSAAAVERTLAPVSRMTSLGSDMPHITGFPGMTAFYGQLAMLFGFDDALETGMIDIIGHSGSDGTFAWAWPELDLMVFYFTQSRGGLTGLRLEREFDRLLVHTDPVEMPEQYKPYLGTYQGDNQTIEVFVHNNHLAVDVPSFIILEMTDPLSRGKWNPKGRWYWIRDKTLSVEFVYAADGEVTAMKFYDGSNPTILLKIQTSPMKE